MSPTPASPRQGPNPPGSTAPPADVEHLRILTSRPEVPTADPPSKDLEKLSIWQRLVAGGLAGAVSKTVIAPADRVKILYQVSRDRKFSLRSAKKTFTKIIEHRGPRGLWAGNSAQLVRIVPYAAIGYLSFDFYQSLLMNGHLLSSLFAVVPSSQKDKRPDGEKILARFLAGTANFPPTPRPPMLVHSRDQARTSDL